MTMESSQSDETEEVVLVKAAPQVGTIHGETVCCAAIDLYGNWLRLYPVSFRYLEDGQKFGRWDRIRFRWRRPRDDSRIESRRVDQDTLTIVGKLKHAEREAFLANLIVTALDREREAGRSFALLKARILEFRYERKSDEELATEKAKFNDLHAQPDLFKTKPLIPYSPAPYRFKYRYESEDGSREGTCQDWEIEATFYKWSKAYGESQALDRMDEVFGQEYPKKGMLLAMGTHSRHPNTWLINGIIRLDEVTQLSLL